MPARIRSVAQVTALFVLASGLAAQQPARDAVVKPSIGTGVIAGTIVTDEPNGKPLRRVTVTLNAAGVGLTPQRVTATDDAGRFAFTRVPAGNYGAPRASKPGYVATTYGEKRTGGIGTPITLAEGQRLAIAMKMLRGGVITGMLLDRGNRPAVQTNVRATQVRVVNGERAPVPSFGYSTAVTDDRGVYRFYGLAPGDYEVFAAPRLALSGEVRPITDAEIAWALQQVHPSSTQTGGGATPSAAPPPRPAQAVAYSPVFYPGTTEEAAATLVTVTAGQERSGIDFGVQFVPTAKIEGTIVDPDGQPPQNAQINLVSKGDPGVMMMDPLYMLDAMRARPVVTDGTFSLAGVRPGQYTVTARAAPHATPGAARPVGPAGRGGPPAAMTLWASIDITVDGTDQSGIALRLEPGMRLSGRIGFYGTVLLPPPDLSRVSVRLSAAPTPGGVTVSVGVPAAQVAADGTFAFEGITPGRYLFSASAPAATPVPGSAWVVRSAIINGADAADSPFEVKPNQDITNVAVSFTDKTAELSGTILDAAGRPTPEFSIILFSTDKTAWSQRSRRLRSPVRATTDGKFKFTNLMPGEYYLAALTDFEPNDYYNPAFLEQVAAAAMKVVLTEGEKKVQDLKIASGSS